MQRWEPRYQALVLLADVVLTAAWLSSWPRRRTTKSNGGALHNETVNVV